MGGVPKSGQELLPPNLQRVKYSALWPLGLDEDQGARQDQQPIGDTLRARGVELDRSTPAPLGFVGQVLFD
jgi:hypothetical protein